MKLMKHITIALAISAIPIAAFGQFGVVTDAAKVTIDCPDDECHVAPYFKGSGGFIGDIAAGFDEVNFVVDCGIVSTTATATPSSGGTVAMLLSMDNGLACAGGGRVEIHGLQDGGWYWINDSDNSAVASLIAKDALGNATVAPADPGGTDITLDTPKDGTTSIVKQASTGRIGILHHILPGPEADPADMCGPVYWAPHGRYYQDSTNCMLGDGSTNIVLTADTTDSQGRVRRLSGTVYRRVGSARDNEVRVGFSLWGADGQAHINDTDGASSADVIKGWDISTPRGHAPAEPFDADFTVALIEGSGRNLVIGDADIRIDPDRTVTEEVPGEEIPGTDPTTRDEEVQVPVTHVDAASMPCEASEDDAMCVAVTETDSTRRLEAGYFMGDMGVAQCRQKHDAHEDDPSRNAVNYFKGADGSEVAVLNGDYADTDLNLAVTGSLAEQESWVREWHAAGETRLNIVQVDDDVDDNDDADPPVLTDNVMRDIPEVVCEMMTVTRTVDVPGTDPTTGPTTTRTLIENGGIIIGPASSLHCRSGRSDVARVWIGVAQSDVRSRNPEIIPAAKEVAEYDQKYAAEVVLNVMCPPSSANQAHHASLGGVDLVPGSE